MKTLGLVVLLACCVIFAGCAPGLNEQINTVNSEGIVAGFWRGLWHGLIAPITFVVSLFARNVQVYEVHNNGGWYNFGFLLGMSAVFGHRAARRAARRTRQSWLSVQ